jgi:hypothetical protein
MVLLPPNTSSSPIVEMFKVFQDISYRVKAVHGCIASELLWKLLPMGVRTVYPLRI